MTAKIHPTALVEDGAALGADVEVGPFAIVERGARLGDGTRVGARAHVMGSVTCGRECEFHVGAVIGHLPQDLAFDPTTETRVEIGDRCVFRENATVHRATVAGAATRIGDDGYFMVQSHIAHDCVIGDRVIMCNNALAAGHVEIDDRAFVSGNTVIHQFCRVGAIVMISGISGTSLDIPPYCIVTDRSTIRGLNVVGMRRAGFDAEARAAVKALYREISAAHGDGAAVRAALEAAPRRPEIDRIRDFYAGRSRKGLAYPLFTGAGRHDD